VKIIIFSVGAHTRTVNRQDLKIRGLFTKRPVNEANQTSEEVRDVRSFWEGNGLFEATVHERAYPLSVGGVGPRQRSVATTAVEQKLQARLLPCVVVLTLFRVSLRPHDFVGKQDKHAGAPFGICGDAQQSADPAVQCNPAVRGQRGVHLQVTQRAVPVAAEHGQQQFVLRVEVSVEGPRTEAGLREDVGDRC
jgi:hypothetical protein